MFEGESVGKVGKDWDTLMVVLGLESKLNWEADFELLLVGSLGLRSKVLTKAELIHPLDLMSSMW